MQPTGRLPPLVDEDVRGRLWAFVNMGDALVPPGLVGFCGTSAREYGHLANIYSVLVIDGAASDKGIFMYQ